MEEIDWFALERSPNAQLVKAGRGREVWRVRTAQGCVYAKLFAPTEGRLLSGLLDRHSAQREWRTLRRAAQLGLAVPKLVGPVLGGPGGRAVILTEEVCDSRSLADVWKQDVEASCAPSRRSTVAALVHAVARAFAQAHAVGFLHRDAHPENILIQREAAGYHATFVDVRGARILGRPAGWRSRARSLAQLDHYFRRRAPRTQRLRFLRAYAALGEAPSDERAFLRALERCRIAHARALARRRDRRLRGDNKYFATIEPGRGARARVALKLGRRHVFPEPTVPDRIATDWRDLLGDLGKGAARGLHVTNFTSRTAVQRLLWTIAGSPARREFLRCHRLRHRDRRAPLVLAYVEYRNAWGLIERAAAVRPA